MIENFTEGQAKDEILKYCIGQKRANIASTELQKNLFPNTSVDVVNILLQEIKDESNGITTINLNNRIKYISINGAAQMFLDQGGFEKKEVDSKSTSDFSKTKDNLEIELAKSNLEANRLNKKNAKQNEKNEKNNKIATWINVGIGIINIGLLIWQILKD